MVNGVPKVVDLQARDDEPVSALDAGADPLSRDDNLESAYAPDGKKRGPIADLNGRERWVVAPLIVLFIVLGFYPKVALDVINPAVSQTLQHVGVTDPAPAVGAVNGSAK
jgi:NADH-quinone oxidoreductase subunit M